MQPSPKHSSSESSSNSSSGSPAGPSPWAQSRIVFVSGKGGVGKSLISAAIAFNEARRGRRVLLVEIGETSYFKDFWGLKEVGHQPTQTAYGFDLARWSTQTSLHEYVLYYLRLERLYRLFFENRVMRTLIDVAPGLSEVAILGKITSGIRKVGPPLDYDLIVVDCFATGHALTLFQAPEAMAAAIHIGPMGQHCREMDRILRDQTLVKYVVVTLAEELPITETREFAELLRVKLGAEAQIIVNKLLRPPVDANELAELEKQPQVQEFAKYLEFVTQRQAGLLKNLGRLVDVPLLLTNDPDALVRRTAEAL